MVLLILAPHKVFLLCFKIVEKQICMCVCCFLLLWGYFFFNCFISFLYPSFPYHSELLCPPSPGGGEASLLQWPSRLVCNLGMPLWCLWCQVLALNVCLLIRLILENAVGAGLNVWFCRSSVCMAGWVLPLVLCQQSPLVVSQPSDEISRLYLSHLFKLLPLRWLILA